ncbi:conjugal transfer pilus assembly protein TraF [Novosphingobium chloroacetimidivorans]|uniref:Conjugal transfer pilus assembly protein TraF n=1 Tax=Novosphingobium chloroacetimidivorans TaxID=1428314 RepID=A0A7W7NYU2_9SPHN|nr:conjugal transfer protein TraF [Novosphingobium chloroacetimidivorans]MBB4860542.1 conjugal transfer pilus assembly protein TraF [Novosphingobium chloroacetimidivorans]
MKNGKWKPVVAGLVVISQLLGVSLPAGAASAQDGVAMPPPDAFYCKERKLGTWFYCDAPRPVVEKENAAAASVPATTRLAAITKQLDELKAKAILEPTPDNVVAYVRYQREQLDRASTFADVWGRSVWQNPELDYTLQRPVNTLGKRAWMDQRKSDRNAVMEGLSQRYGLFYFFSSSCGACEVFSPILKSLADQYSMSVLPVSMDGGPNSAFPSFVTNTGQYERMGLNGGQVPALVLFDSVTKQPIPIGYGVMSADEVMQRIFVLTKVEPGSDY